MRWNDLLPDPQLDVGISEEIRHGQAVPRIARSRSFTLSTSLSCSTMRSSVDFHRISVTWALLKGDKPARKGQT